MAPDTERLRYPLSYVWRIRVATAAAIGVTLVALYSAVFESPSDPIQLRWMYAVLMGAALAAFMLLRYHRLLSFELVLMPDAVLQQLRGVEIQRLRWSEISSARFRSLTRELELLGVSAGTRIRVAEPLIGFGVLLGMVETSLGRPVDRVLF